MNIIRKTKVVIKVGQSFSTIDRLEKRGEFPQRIQLSPKSVGWSEEEVDAYLESLPRGPVKEPTLATQKSLKVRQGSVDESVTVKSNSVHKVDYERGKVKRSNP